MGRARRSLAILLGMGWSTAAGMAAARPLRAQGGAPPAAPTPIVLQLRPRPGDQLHLRLDQTIEMGVVQRQGDDTTATDVTSLSMLARLWVESADVDGATVIAVADSVRVDSPGRFDSNVLRQARALQGQRVRFRVAPDGAMLLSGADAWAGPTVGSLLSQLPATLPREAVAPGATWSRSVDIPLAATPDGRSNATLTATFRFDSLSRTGDYAYLSMKGRLVRSGPVKGGANDGGFVQTSGTVNASLILDRRRGWIADARTVIALRSLVSGRAKESGPLRVRMQITQWMRVM
jgi:hypothetical protein